MNNDSNFYSRRQSRSFFTWPDTSHSILYRFKTFKISRTGNRLKKNVYTKFRVSRLKIFRNNQNSLKSPRNFRFCDFDTGVFFNVSQINQTCEKIQDAGIYLILQEAGNYLYFK